MESGEDERVAGCVFAAWVIHARGIGWTKWSLPGQAPRAHRRHVVKRFPAWARGTRRVRVRGQTGLPLGRMLPARARAGTVPCPGRHAFDQGTLPGHALYAQRSGHMTIAGSRHRPICPAWHIFDHGTRPRDRAGGRFRRHIGRFQRPRLPDARMKIFGSSRYRAVNSGILKKVCSG